MKLIKLRGKYGRGKFAQVDDEDFEQLRQYKWHMVSKGCNHCYAVTSVKLENKHRTSWLMHRIIMQVTNPKMFIDHIDGDGLNNQRSNLRTATNSQNQANASKGIYSCTSKYKGVCFFIANKNTVPIPRWKAYCNKDGKSYQRQFKTEIEAAIEYNKIAVKLHGEYAKLNIIENE